MFKKSILLKILISVVVIIVLFIVLVVTRPDDFRVTRSAKISASPSEVFAQVNDLRKWDAWSPWAKLDPTAKQTFEGPATGTGAGFTWAGNNQVGEGRMTISESRPDELVRFKLEFIKPFAAKNDTEFTFKPEGNQTLVTWTMSGKNNFISKAMSLFIDCDKMIGGQFEQGLAQMKSIVEKPAEATAKQ